MKDVHMTDLIYGRESLKLECSLLAVAVGGFQIVMFWVLPRLGGSIQMQ
ncbi:MAG: hypothetical protein IPN72_22685 [Saprospiraceae bacterium]|nr:hypothetical protein [Saprospiraceae bacterium]